MRVQLCLTLWLHGLYSLPGSSVHGISQEEYWRRLPFPFPGDLPDPEIKPYLLCHLQWQGDFFCHWASFEAPKYQEADIKSDFTVYNIPLLLLFYSMWLEVFLYAVVILITFVLPRKVSLNSLGFVLCLSLEKGNWTNSLNRETFSLRIWKCH